MRASSLSRPIVALLSVLAGAAAWKATGAPGEAPLRVKLPFPAGQSYKVMQGNRGAFSHNDEWNRFAWDFDMAVGTPIAAAATGTVVDVKEDSSSERAGFRRDQTAPQYARHGRPALRQAARARSDER